MTAIADISPRDSREPGQSPVGWSSLEDGQGKGAVPSGASKGAHESSRNAPRRR